MDIWVDQVVELGESKPPKRLLQGVEKYLYLQKLAEPLASEASKYDELLEEMDEVWDTLTKEDKDIVDPSGSHG